MLEQIKNVTQIEHFLVTNLLLLDNMEEFVKETEGFGVLNSHF